MMAHGPEHRPPAFVTAHRAAEQRLRAAAQATTVPRQRQPPLYVRAAKQRQPPTDPSAHAQATQKQVRATARPRERVRKHAPAHGPA